MPTTRMVPDSNLEAIKDKGIIKALVIEDYEPMRDQIEDDLKELGYSVDSFAYPKDAAGIIADENYQLSVVDIDFKGRNISGDEFVRKNIDVLGNGKIVAFTAYPKAIAPENKRFFTKTIM